MSAASKHETSFEQAMQRLEEIVSGMESDRMPLDEMVGSYEEGMKLLQICRQRIENARQRIETISLGADGKAELTAFDPAKTADSAEAKAPTRRRTAATKADPEEISDDIRLF